MKKAKFFFILLFVCFSGVSMVTAQESEKSLQVAEINKMVELNEVQKEKLNNLHSNYLAAMDSAINRIEDKRKAAFTIHRCKQTFNTNLMELLSDEQKVEYIRNYATPEVAEKARVKVQVLRKSDKYTKEELKKHFDEIFEYLMLEKIVYVTERYNIDKQKENIAQLKKLEPKGLKAANTFQKIKHQGKRYQDGFQW